MSSRNARNSSTHSDAATLRPRTKRLISGFDEGDGTAFNDHLGSSSARIPSPVSSQYAARAASPIPPAHPQRPSSGQANGRRTATLGRDWVGGQKNLGSESAGIANFWGHSWNALQGIASDLIGNDSAREGVKDKPRVRRTLGRPSNPRSLLSGPVNAWGPRTPGEASQSSSIAIGTREEQTASFRAQKKRDMLTGAQSSYADALGKFKRRVSDDRTSASAPPADDDPEALVYVHHVTKDDTLAGITIRYNIAANALRKANRMWPNDTVQIRQTLILPVDACRVKGRPCAGPGQVVDLLSSENESLLTMRAEEVPTPTLDLAAPVSNGAVTSSSRDRTNSQSTHSSLALSGIETEPLWHHDSWVMLPGNRKPTEIARLSRRALGYFPPPRRKSQNFSDTETPSTSFDIARNDLTGTPRSPSRGTPPRGTKLARRLSNATNGYFPTYLSGPGGVGTMGKSVHFPGPAQDGLNKLFAKHLPDVAPPKNQNWLYHPDVPLYSDDPTPDPSGAGTPAYPHSAAGGGGSGMNLENVGGAIESWVRRLASKTKSPLPDRQSAARASVGTPGKGAGGIGDLIEMTDEFEIGGDDEEEERGRQSSTGPPPPHVQISAPPPPQSSATSYFEGAATRRGGSSAKSGKAD